MHEVPALKHIDIVAVPVRCPDHTQASNDLSSLIDDEDLSTLLLGRILDALDELGRIEREERHLLVHEQEQLIELLLILALGNTHTGYTTLDVIERLHDWSGPGRFFMIWANCLRIATMAASSILRPASGSPSPSAVTISGSITSSPPAVRMSVPSSSSSVSPPS